MSTFRPVNENDPGVESEASGSSESDFDLGPEPGAEPAPAVEQADGGDQLPAAAKRDDGTLTKEAWIAQLRVGFAGGAVFLQSQTLTVATDWPTFQPAAEKLYESIDDVPSLRFLLRPLGKWPERIVVILAFGLPLAAGLKAEAAERKRALAEKPAQTDSETPGEAGASQAA